MVFSIVSIEKILGVGFELMWISEEQALVSHLQTRIRIGVGVWSVFH
jgi:hypothetical protein